MTRTTSSTEWLQLLVDDSRCTTKASYGVIHNNGNDDDDDDDDDDGDAQLPITSMELDIDDAIGACMKSVVSTAWAMEHGMGNGITRTKDPVPNSCSFTFLA